MNDRSSTAPKLNLERANLGASLASAGLGVTGESALSFDAAIRLGVAGRLRNIIAGVLGTLLLHGTFVLYGFTTSLEVARFARDVMQGAHAMLSSEIDVDMKEPEPEPEPEPPPPEPEPEPEARPKPPTNPDEPPPPPPAAAEAAQVLAAEPDPDEPLDLTGNTFVVGTGESYAGGVTASSGTSKSAVYDRGAKPTGVVGGTGPAPAPQSTVDLSRPALPASRDWNCPFPPEADIEQINYMRVSVVVHVAADGRAKSVDVLNDPGFGFGRTARQCALRQSYQTALNRQGKPIAQSLSTNVTFKR